MSEPKTTLPRYVGVILWTGAAISLGLLVYPYVFMFEVIFHG